MRQDELREILEIEGYNYLVNLQESLSYSGNEHSSVWYSKGTLRGICMVTGIDFEEEKRYKITFFKKNTKDPIEKGKLWFVVKLDMTEEDADERIEAWRREIREESAMRRKFFS